ncbi:MAG: DUF2917 domain-containing protein [Gemmatimonadota bacterium]
MNIELQASSLVLARDGMIAVRDAKGVRITCLTGALWITQDNYVKDFIVGAGESHTIDYAGLTLVTALEATTLSVREASLPLLARIGNGLARRFSTLLPRPAPL